MPEMLISLLPLILMFVVFYFLLIRPQQKRQREVVSMQRGLKRGDAVVTIGGFHGVIDVINDEEDTITLKSVDNSKLKFTRNAIATVVKSANVDETAIVE
ncbi:MAG: preprotein translocase subunit YajC [Bacilli bacterium]